NAAPSSERRPVAADRAARSAALVPGCVTRVVTRPTTNGSTVATRTPIRSVNGTSNSITAFLLYTDGVGGATTSAEWCLQSGRCRTGQARVRERLPTAGR